MISKFLASRGNRALVLTIAALLAFLLELMILRHGIKSWPDSWYDWEGSINLIEHGTYTTMLGVHIQEWPPLYSIYLAAFQLILGQTGWAIILSMSVLAAVNAAVWGSYVFKVFPTDEMSLSGPGILGSLVFLVFFLPINFINMLANPLLLIFVGLILHLLAAIAEDATQWGGVKKAGVVGILLGLGIYTHHSTIIYVAASVIVIMLSMPTPLRPRLLAVGIILLISGSVWLALPHGIGTKADHAARVAPTTGGATVKYLPETGTHFLFDPKYSFGEYLVQTPAGFGVFFLPLSSVAAQAALGVVILGTAVFFLVRRPDSKLESRHRVFLGFALIAVLGHFAIFNLVWLDTVFGDRFAWYLALVATPIFYCRFRRSPQIVMVLIVLTVGVSGWRLCKLVWHGAVPALTASTGEASVFAIHPEYFLSSLPNPVVPAGDIRIGPPVYAWSKTPTGMAPDHIHESVLLISPGTSQP